MENEELITLLEKGRFEEVLSLTEGKNDPDALFLRAASLLRLSRPLEAMDIIEKHREALYKAMPLRTLKSDFELRFALGEFDEAYADLKIFQEFPYVSQAVEEALAELPKRIRAEERNALLPKGHDRDAIKRMLHAPKDDYEALSALNMIAKEDIAPYQKELESLLLGEGSETVKTYAFLLFVAHHWEKEIAWRKKGEVLRLVPARCKPPFVGPLFERMKHRLEADARDPGLYGAAIAILNNLTLELYPREVYGETDFALVEAALLSLAADYLSLPQEEKTPANELDEEAVKRKKEEFAALLKQAETLRF